MYIYSLLAVLLTHLLELGICSEVKVSDVTLVILSQSSYYDNLEARSLRTSVIEQLEGLDLSDSFDVVLWPNELNNTLGYWTLWTQIKRLMEEHPSKWFTFAEVDTSIDVSKLISFLAKESHTVPHYFGYGLVDAMPTIIHHFYGHDHSKEEPFKYPDFSAGLVVSSQLMTELVNSLEDHSFHQFAIDAKHEFARYIWENLSVRLTSRKDVFCLLPSDSTTCAMQYRPPQYQEDVCSSKLSAADVYVAVKTYSGYHKSRLVVLKRTWSRDLPNVEYVSDMEDMYVPTITVGVENTAKGHCGKTFAILRRFLTLHFEKETVNWVFIADDDSLVSMPRLLRLLSCQDNREKLIIGERYGYGFSAAGYSGYDYPTGGSGMVFSRSAVEAMVESCDCPSDDSPDDMIIGMCASSLGIPVLHSSAFHQARRSDYAEDYVSKMDPISFHKFEDIDPYYDYMHFLDEKEPAFDMNGAHDEL